VDNCNVTIIAFVTGWRFEALVVVRDGIVLSRNFAGEPHNDHIEHQVNPLGPLQSSGESVASRAVR
jgi:hypothetical protein